MIILNYHTRSPWQVASSVPPNTTKTVLDAFAWHGYHSVSVPYGRFRYRTSPQGLKPLEDGYTHRTDELIGDEENHAKIVDDSILWNDDIRANFFKTCEFIRKCAQSGIIFNPKKFQFAPTPTPR